MIWENQVVHYKAIKNSTDANDSSIFVDFMLEVILETVKAHAQGDERDTKKVTVKVTLKVTANQQKILDAIKKNPYITQVELSAVVVSARKNVIISSFILYPQFPRQVTGTISIPSSLLYA